jgi:phosphatidylethanolamine-binding protein (PEBP) family uncharacterized protein
MIDGQVPERIRSGVIALSDADAVCVCAQIPGVRSLPTVLDSPVGTFIWVHWIAVMLRILQHVHGTRT